MLSPRISLGIAQLIFYLPAVPIAIFLFIRNWKYRPRMAWWPMVPLTLMRFAGGTTTIIFEKEPSVGLYIAAIILLNVGAIPLIVATLGQIRIILQDNYSHSPHLHRTAKGIRLSFVGAVAMLVTGGALSSVSGHVSRILSLVGYILFAVILGVLTSMELWLFLKRSELIPSSRKVLKAAMLAAPLLAIRTIYGILQVAFKDSNDSIWSSLVGNLYAFCFMCLFPEYIAMCIYFWLGFSMAPDRGVRHASLDNEENISKQMHLNSGISRS